MTNKQTTAEHLIYQTGRSIAIRTAIEAVRLAAQQRFAESDQLMSQAYNVIGMIVRSRYGDQPEFPSDVWDVLDSADRTRDSAKRRAFR